MLDFIYYLLLIAKLNKLCFACFIVKMVTRNFKLAVVLVLLLVLSSSSVLGLGVSPAIVNVDFIPNSDYKFEMSIYNQPARNLNVSVYFSFLKNSEDANAVAGELGNFISFSNKKLEFSEDENMEKVNVTLNFPAGVSKAGVYELRIGAVKASEIGGMGFVAGNEIVVFLNISQEYTGDEFIKIKKLEIINFTAKDIYEGEKSRINIVVRSKSDNVLYDVSGKIKIMQNKSLIKELETNKIDLNPGETRNLSAIFNAENMTKSALKLDAEVFYEDNSETATTNLNILKKNSSWWIWILIFLLLLFLLIILFIWRRKRKKDENEAVQSEELEK